MALRTIATLSNCLTFLRIMLAPIVLGTLLHRNWLLSFWIIVIAFLTDFFDGLLARFFDEQTELGAMLDPIADKIFLTTCIWALVFIQHPLFHLPAWFFYVLLAREFLILTGTFVLRWYASLLRVQPTLFGKISAAIQMFFIVWLFISYFFAWQFIQLNYLAMLLVVALSVLSFVHYCIIHAHYLRR